MKILNLKYCIGTLAASLLLAACASDELTDGTVQDLPEGMYPLQIAGVSLTAESSAEPWGADSPQTRVSENTTDGNSSVWDGGEEITVQLSGTMADGTPYTAEGQYTLGDDKQTLTPVSGKELYWRSTSAGTVTAWCSPTASDNTINLSNQSNGLAYVLKAEASNVTYNTSPSLSFTHQLAKIRVALGDGSTADLFNDDAKVEVYNYPSCTVSNGTIDKNSLPTEGYITMHKVTYSDKTYYEANIVPNGAVSKFRITLKDKTAKEMTIGSPVALAAAKLHLITLTVTNAEITLGNNPVNINDNGEYTISGTGTQTITINGSPTVTLKDVNIANNNCIHIKSGSPTIILEGTNKLGLTLTQTKEPLFRLEGENTNVTIQGDGTLEIDATVSGNWEAPAIGPVPGKRCGNITILGGTIKAYASTTAGIGSSMNGTCGNITIKNATVHVKGSPAIGASTLGYGGNSSCGDILIENTNLTAEVQNEYRYSGTYYHVDIGCGCSDSGGTITCGTITIRHIGKTRAEILSTITGGQPLIGKGTTNGTSSCGLITIIERNGTQTQSGDIGVSS